MTFDPTIHRYPPYRRGESILIDIRTERSDLIDMVRLIQDAYVREGFCTLVEANTFIGFVIETIKFHRVVYTDEKCYLQITVSSFSGTGKREKLHNEMPHGFTLRKLTSDHVIKCVSERIGKTITFSANENGAWLIVDAPFLPANRAGDLIDDVV